LEPTAIQHYARVRIGLERAGSPIGANDLLIAAHALALDAVLVSDNEREFARIDGLRLENWLR
jgi:tRNA(fMet)-specific endonuclease VapC